jgi:threonyl-tRNA synthetase
MSDKYLAEVEKIAEAIGSENIRVDIDDRTLTLQKRIREAEMEWIPYIIVVGQKELESNTLPVRKRKSGKIQKMALEDLIGEIRKIVEGKPFKPLPIPKHLSQRPQFYG